MEYEEIEMKTKIKVGDRFDTGSGVKLEILAVADEWTMTRFPATYPSIQRVRDIENLVKVGIYKKIDPRKR